MDDLIAELERRLPSDERVLLACAANPITFLAIHGMCANDYIAELRKARKALAALKARKSGPAKVQSGADPLGAE